MSGSIETERDGARSRKMESRRRRRRKGGGHYCVRVPCTTTLRAVHACNRFSFQPLPSPPSPSPLLLSLVRPVKINKGTINKNYTFFIHLAREGGWGLAWGSNQRSWLYTLLVHLPPFSSTRAQPPSFPAFDLSFFWKEKEKEKGRGRGEKEIFFDRSVDADRFRRGGFSRCGLIGVFFSSSSFERWG